MSVAVGSLAEVGPARGLPRGRASLPAAEVAQAQRDRMLRAVTAAVAANGYANVTIAELVKRARVSRESFYSQFTDKEECFLAAHEEGIALILTRVLESAARGSDREPGEQLRQGIRTYLRLTVDEPEFAQCMLIELQAIGPRGLETRIEAHRRIAGVLGLWHADAASRTGWPTVSPGRYAAAVGAVHDLVFDVVARARSTDAPRLEEEAYSAVAALLEIPTP